MIKVKDKWFRILAVALPVLLVVYFRFFFQHGFNLRNTGAVLITFIGALALTEGSRKLIYQSRPFFARIQKRWLRLFVLIPAGILYSTFVYAVGKALSNYVRLGDWMMYANTGSNLYVNDVKLTSGVIGSAATYSFFIFLFLLAVYETLYHFARLRYTERERDDLEREKLKAELQQLKGIINPHFLFNNLNSLSSLISEDPAQAEVFLDELTKVFRYLLRNNETDLTTLENELGLLQSYYHLLQVRFGKGVALNVQVAEEAKALLLPPLTLQLLVENAVKHNHYHTDHPLQIQLFTTSNNTLVVRNTLRKKQGLVESTGIGLNSINRRYHMLQRPELSIEQDDQWFAVTIALIDMEQPALAAATKRELKEMIQK
ncbi:sensor histidine kinase [Flavisolibacter tropicus]|uniref:sensor histidine kinase n=1 Tax=Flavisolibacter tropicus TaxID=1492898 RepID=UPI0008344787|nr:sensor histidine kinase [Flavisolibacter tropicus]